MSDSEILRMLLDRLRQRQSRCPYCGSECSHDLDCVLDGRWHPFEVDEDYRRSLGYECGGS